MEAFQGQSVVLVVTVKVCSPPAFGNVRVVGVRAVTVQAAPAWVMVNGVFPMVMVPVLTDDWLEGNTVILAVALFLLQVPILAVIQGSSSIITGAGQTVIPVPVTVTFVLSPKPFAGKVFDEGERL